MGASQMTGWTIAVLLATALCRVRNCTSWTRPHCRARFGWSLAEQVVRESHAATVGGNRAAGI